MEKQIRKLHTGLNVILEGDVNYGSDMDLIYKEFNKLNVITVSKDPDNGELILSTKAVRYNLKK